MIRSSAFESAGLANTVFVFGPVPEGVSLKWMVGNFIGDAPSSSETFRAFFTRSRPSDVASAEAGVPLTPGVTYANQSMLSPAIVTGQISVPLDAEQISPGGYVSIVVNGSGAEAISGVVGVN